MSNKLKEAHDVIMSVETKSRKCEHGMMPWECGYCYDKKSDDIQAEREALIKRARERREYFQAIKNFSSVGFYDDLINHLEEYK